MTHRLVCVHASEDYYDQNYGTQFVPLWAYCLAAYVPEPWRVSIVDCKNQDPRDCGPADVFAFSGINQDVHAIHQVWSALKARHPDACFILGGPITWSFDQEGKLSQLDYFDHLFILDGEETLPAFLTGRSQGLRAPKVIRGTRFPLDQSRKLPFQLFRPSFSRYYGGVIEVSRGCPFLCEFCDIRVLPGNNRSNNKPVPLIIEELDEYYRLGITRIQFACDNFIGDVAWARSLLQAMIEWKARVGADISVFTWLTINLYKHRDIMEMMRRAGFSILFIGIESVNQHSLLETAKMQNVNVLEEAVTTVASYGFIIAPGFIFGFDSDTDSMFDDTLRFLAESGIIGGDPAFLMALPGTPLFDRMKRTGRLVESDEGVARKKIQTNIRYLQDSKFLAQGFVEFINTYTSAPFQYARFKRLIDLVQARSAYVPVTGPGYGSPLPYFKLQIRHPRYVKMLFGRVWFLLRRPANVWAVLKALVLVRRSLGEHPGLGAHFFYWIYAWTNIALKYEGLRQEDFALHSVERDFDVAKLAPIQLTVEHVTSQVRDGIKVEAQARFTNRALKRLFDERQASARERA
jgi:radical SAM superfamily enzyme YgiQ (UPF0313 family)